MGRYVDWDDVVLRYSEVSKGLGGAAEISSTHINYAERELDSRLANYFTVPFSSNNVTAKDLSIDLSYLRMANLKRGTEEREQFVTEIDNRIEALKTGDAAMVLIDGTLLNTTGDVVYSSTMNYHPTFGVGETPSFVVDSSQIADEEAARV